VIYGGVDARGVRFDNVADALAVPQSDLRLFGKPEATRSAGWASRSRPARDTAQARDRAKLCARRVVPRAA
jgi:phosphoribosylglycinamide formyltransferase 2